MKQMRGAVCLESVDVEPTQYLQSPNCWIPDQVLYRIKTAGQTHIEGGMQAETECWDI